MRNTIFSRTLLGLAALLALLVFSGSHCGGDDDHDDPTEGTSVGSLQIHEPWARSADSERGAAYMHIQNTGAEEDALISAEAEVAGKTGLHEVVMDGDNMVMRPVERIVIPGNGDASLRPGGYHVMLMGLKEPLKEGTTIKIKLTFEKAGSVTLDVPVKAFVEPTPTDTQMPGGMGTPTPTH